MQTANDCFLKKARRISALLLLSFIICLGALAQKRVTGVVKGTDNAPLSGATVEARGTNTSVATGVDGSFAIMVPKGSTVLVISYVGLETVEVSIASIDKVELTLKTRSSSLQEIVVTGYSSQRKKDITGAVTVVNIADMKSQPSIDATSQLQGRASGVTVVQNAVPGAGATVRIRGLGSFNNNSPLYVIDGVQSGSISGLSPNDIESMQVLKDAASASIYGVRASNGVIIVTTKKGRRKGVNISYDMYYGTQNPGKSYDVLNAQEEANLLFLARKNSGLSTAGSVYGSGTTPVLPDYIYYTGAPNNGTPINSGNPGVDPSK